MAFPLDSAAGLCRPRRTKPAPRLDRGRAARVGCEASDGEGIIDAAAGEKSQLGGALIVVFAAVAISLSFVLARLVYDAGSDPPTLIVLRYAAFVALVWGLCRLTGRSLALPRRRRWLSYATGLVYLVGTGSYLGAILWLPVSLAVLIFYAYPLLTLMAMAALERRRPRATEVVGLSAALLGIALALQVSFAALDPRGIALALLGACGAAGSFVLTSRHLAGVDPVVNTFHMSVSGLLAALLATLAMGGFVWPLGGAGWALMAATVLVFAAAFLAIFAGVGRVGAVRAAAIMNLEPVATVLLALLILGERLSAVQFLGAGLVVAAVVLAQRRPVPASGAG